MENETVKLPLKIATRVEAELIKQGVIESKPGRFQIAFTEEQLSHITSLEFINPIEGDLSCLTHFKNLTKLEVSTKGDLRYNPDKKLSGISFNDMVAIEGLESLEDLKITNQRNLEFVDLSKLKNLKSLSLTRNPNLQQITGLTTNDSIKSLEIYDCESLEKIVDKKIGNPQTTLSDFICNNRNLESLNLDMLLFPQVIGYNVRNKNYDMNSIDRLKHIKNIKWSESCANRLISISNSQMYDIHQKAIQIVDETCPGFNALDNVISINRWLAENVRYDYNALNLRKETNGKIYSHIGLVAAKDGPMKGALIPSGPTNGPNGLYNALKFKFCVCEGYSRAMQYMCGLKGITTSKVSCIAKEDNTGYVDSSKSIDSPEYMKLPDDGFHSNCRVDYQGNGYYYCDPCWNAGCFQANNKSLPYTMLTQNEIKKTHTLCFYERGISSIPFHKPTLNQSKQAVEQRFSNKEM